MTVHLPAWSPETERSFKEILYRFMGEVQATKAALYFKREDGNWSLATHYGFGRRDRVDDSFTDDHTLVRMVRAFSEDPRLYNDSDDLGEVADYLAGAGNERLMLVPLVVDDELVGFVDVRDKGRKRPFVAVDLVIARSIGEDLNDLIGEFFYTEKPDPGPDEPAEIKQRPPVDLATEAVDEPAALLDDQGFEELRTAAVETLVDPRMIIVALTIASRDAGATLAFQREGTPTTELRAIVSHQIDAMQRASIPVPPKRAWKTEVRRVSGRSSEAPAQFITSSVLLEGFGSSLTASVVVDAEPALSREALARVQRRVKIARDRFLLRISRRGLVRRLLQPGDRRYPELVAHSLGVSRLCWSLAQALDFDDRLAEEAALAGLVHDVGMRELDYDRLYLHPTPGPEDRRTYRMHVEVGDRIVRVEGLTEIADAVRHHHERWDGNGYPDQLSKEAIPLLARIVHVAEVFDLFTAANSYRPAVSHERALAILDRAAGHQFDPSVVGALARVVA